MNVQLCPTLYISLTYDGGIIPTRQCTNTNATESLKYVLAPRTLVSSQLACFIYAVQNLRLRDLS
jgi:hypothetical protein